MKTVGAIFFGLAFAGAVWGSDSFSDLADKLSFSSPDGNLRGKLSGTLDLEGYWMDEPAPGLIFATGQTLFNPRLSLFLDGQLGPQLYAFAQARVDRGFDPNNRRIASRLDEYALRYTPWQDGRVNLQVGKFSTVIGNWVERHLAWDNPFVGAPLAYEHLTAMWDSMPPDSIATLRGWAHLFPIRGYEEYSDKALRLPIIWGPSYATGAAVSGRSGKIQYAVEFKNASVSSRPEQWDLNGSGWSHPTLSGRIAFRPSPTWTFGLSGSQGSYLEPRAQRFVSPGYGLRDYKQVLLAQDVSFAWHHFQLWAEAFECKFVIPRLGDAEVVSYYVEAKYKFTPQFFGAVRWNQEIYREFKPLTGPKVAWGRDVSRVDIAATWRLSVSAQLKLQYSTTAERTKSAANTVAGQVTLRF